MKKSQAQVILEYLQAGNIITQRGIIERFGWWRLSAFIYHIKREYNIEVEDELIEVSKGHWVKRYWLPSVVTPKF